MLNFIQLKEQKLQISSGDVIEALTEKFKDVTKEYTDQSKDEIKECTDQCIQQIEERKNQWLRETIGEIRKREEKTCEHLETILTKALEEIQHNSDRLQRMVSDNAEASYESRKGRKCLTELIFL